MTEQAPNGGAAPAQQPTGPQFSVEKIYVEGNTVYMVEVQQAGVFGLAGFEPQVVDALLGTQCPNVLYPYARQLISELIQAGGFAPFLLQPINFDALYAEGLRQRQAQAQAESQSAPGGDLANSETAGNA